MKTQNNRRNWILTSILASILGFAESQAFANPDLDRLFHVHYSDHYEERRCGENALGFIEDANRKLGMAKDLYLIMIEDKGWSNFGLVQAEMARRVDRPGQTHDMNWGYHAFVMDQSGDIYDFDYGPKPTVTGIRSYLENMFLNDNECTTPPQRRGGDTCISRDNRLSDYEITIVRGDQVISRDESEKKKFKLGQVWKDWRILLKNQ